MNILSILIANNESLVDTDLVLWHTVGSITSRPPRTSQSCRASAARFS
jgi:hypothetical protein